MYKILDFHNESEPRKFIELLKSKWDSLHESADIFRYKIDNLKERLVDDKYILQLNPDRRDKRRAPEQINNISQPFDKNKFNFTKVSPKEILFSIEDKESEIHTVLVNVSPINRYHSLLCPSVNKCLPQVLTNESLMLAIEIMFLAQDRNLRILYNSLCAFASVNHLHYHLFIETNDFYVENVDWQHVTRNIYRLDEKYPVPAFCFEVERNNISQAQVIFKVLRYFLENNIAHNILLTRRQRLGGTKDSVKVLLWPRRSTTGAKQFAAMNVAVLELSGWFPVYDADTFMSLKGEVLEEELLKWNINNFDQLCADINSLEFINSLC